MRADALRAKDPALAAQLAVAAYRIADTREAQSTVLNATGADLPSRLPGPPAVTQSVAVHDGRRLLVSSSGSSPTVRVWSVADHGNPLLLAETGPAAAALQAVALSPDGRTLAAGGKAGTVVLIDLAQPERPGPTVAIAMGDGDPVLSIAFAADGRTLFAGTGAGVVRRWVLGGAELPPLTGPGGPVNAVAIAAAGRLVAAGSDDNAVHLWDLADPTRPPIRLNGPTGKVFAVAFDPDARTLVAGSADHLVHVWNVGDPAVPVPAGQLAGATNWVNSAAISPDGRTVAAGSSDGHARLWDLASGRLRATLPHPGPVTSTAFVGEGLLATGEADGVAHLWPVPGPTLTGFDDAVFALNFDRTGRILVAGPGSKDGSAGLWDPGARRARGAPVRSPAGEPAFSGSAALTPDGALLAVGRVDGSVRMWNVSDAANPLPIDPPLIGSTGLVEQLTFSADGGLLAVSSDDNTVRLWDVGNPLAARLRATLAAATSYVFASAFSPDGSLLAAASADTNGYLWDLRQDPPALIGTLRGPSSYAYSPAFSPDGRTLAIGSADKTIRLWDLTDPARATQMGAPLTGPSAYVYSVAFSPDGRTLAAASTDGNVWTWDVTTRADPVPGALLTGPQDAVFSVTWSPDGRWIAAGSADRTVRLWAADAAEAAADICRRAGAPVTAQEWARYVPDLPYRASCVD